MSDEQPVPVTLETIVQELRDFRSSTEKRFDSIDQRLTSHDEQFRSIDQRLTSHDQQFTSIRDRLTSHDQQFKSIDQRFTSIDQRFDELKAQLRTEMEAVRADIKLVAEAFAGQVDRNAANDAAHGDFTKRLDNHGARILALEKKPARSRKPVAGSR